MEYFQCSMISRQFSYIKWTAKVPYPPKFSKFMDFAKIAQKFELKN